MKRYTLRLRVWYIVSPNAYWYVMVKFAFAFHLNIDNNNMHMKLITSCFGWLDVTEQNVRNPNTAVKCTIVNEIFLRVESMLQWNLIHLFVSEVPKRRKRIRFSQTNKFREKFRRVRSTFERFRFPKETVITLSPLPPTFVWNKLVKLWILIKQSERQITISREKYRIASKHNNFRPEGSHVKLLHGE